MPYLVAGPRTMAGEFSSPPQTLFTGWLNIEGIDRTRGNQLTVWDETPIRAQYEVFDLDAGGDKIPDGNGGYTTTPETFNVSALPPISGTTL